MVKSKPKTVLNNILNYFRKEKLPILTLETKISTLAIKKINVAIMDTNAYYTTCKLKRVQVFAIFTKDPEYQVEKEV